MPGLPLEPVELGNSDELVIGDWVVCIGNPIGFTGTATAGIVSGLNREIESDNTKPDKYGKNNPVVNSMIQTDAAINSGNSGGGMFNTVGQLVGIPTLKYTGTRYSSNATVESIGMCIPINEAKDVIEAALSGKGTVEGVQQNAAAEDEGTTGGLTGKPRMGVTVSTVKDTNGQLPRGAYVVKVEEGSPAETAGLKVGDIMVEVNGQVISTVTEEIEIISQLKEGDEVAVRVWRPESVSEDGRISTEGEYIDLTVKLAVVDEIAQ